MALLNEFVIFIFVHWKRFVWVLFFCIRIISLFKILCYRLSICVRLQIFEIIQLYFFIENKIDYFR